MLVMTSVFMACQNVMWTGSLDPSEAEAVLPEAAGLLAAAACEQAEHQNSGKNKGKDPFWLSWFSPFLSFILSKPGW